MDIKSHYNQNPDFGHFPSFSKHHSRGAYTELNHKSGNGYNLFSTPKIFNKESVQSIIPTKTLLKFDDSEATLSTPSKTNSNIEAGASSITENLFAKAQMSKYKNNYVVSFNSGKKLTEDNPNKENKLESSDQKQPIPKPVIMSGSKAFLQSLSQAGSQSVQPKCKQMNSPNTAYREFFPQNEEKSFQRNLFDTKSIESQISPFPKDGLKKSEPVDAKKLKKDSQLSPRTKSYFEEIEKKRKDINSKSSSVDLLNYYLGLMNEVNSKYHWKIFLDLAEAFKKDCNYNYAKSFYKIAAHMQPYNADTWLEYAKMEEDYGNLSRVKDILKQGIHFNNLNENLIIKFLRVEEKFGRIEESRKILSKLRHCSIEKSWKLYLEGAMLEAKLGNPKTAQRIFKMLLKNLEMQGNVYLEYAKFEENMGNILGALKITYEGINKNIRFSNLWGYFMRICERIVAKIGYIPLDNYLTFANDCLPKDMLWKIYLEIAGVAERKNEYDRSKAFITKAIQNCPENVKWKCFILGARIELKDNCPLKAKKIIHKFIENANEKQKYHLLIESSKIAEYLGDIRAAVSHFEETKDYMRAEWKVYLEYIHMLTRNNQFDQAYQVAKESLYYHNLAGRLWASLIQLNHISGLKNPGIEAYKVFLVAINEVPKSGEVWCEGARICLNPYSGRFDLAKARQFLNFAIYFTPQYGDSFVEAIRLYLLLGDKKELSNLKKKVINSQPNYGNVWQFLKGNAGESVHETWKNAKKVVRADLLKDGHMYKVRMSEAWESNPLQKQHTCQILTACHDYNLILQGKRVATPEEKWKLIFHTDQSLL